MHESGSRHPEQANETNKDLTTESSTHGSTSTDEMKRTNDKNAKDSERKGSTSNLDPTSEKGKYIRIILNLILLLIYLALSLIQIK